MNVRTHNLRFTVLVGAVALTSAVAACGGSSSSGGVATSAAPAATETTAAGGSSAPAASDSAAPAAAGAGIDVGTGKVTPKDTTHIAYMVQAGKTFSYTAAQAQGAADAGKQLGVSVDVYYSNLDPGVELSNFNQIFPTHKYGGLIVQSVTEQLCKTIASDSVKNEILVEVVGNPLCGQATAVGEANWSPGTITYMGGQNGVDGITTLLEAAAKEVTGPQKVMMVVGTKGHPSSIAWETALKAFQTKHSDWSLSKEVFTDFTSPGSFAAVQNSLQGNKDITLLTSLYIDVTAGLVKAVAAQGLTGKVKVYDNGGGSKVTTQLFTEGKVNGTLPVYPYSLGFEGVKTMVAALKGTQPPRYIGGDGNPDAQKTGVLNKETIKEFKPQW